MFPILPLKFEQNIESPMRLDVDVEMFIFIVNVFIKLFNFLNSFHLNT